MYTKTFFEKLYAFNKKANNEMIYLIEENPNAYTERTQILISHTLNAHHIWNYRLSDKEALLGVWQKHAIEDLKQLNEENFTLSAQLLDQLDYTTILSYTDSKGKAYQKEIGTILFHIVNHSTYHRGQLMSELKLQGVIPVSLDYVFLEN